MADEILFIDPHALHERILFEQLQERFRSGALEGLHLLISENGRFLLHLVSSTRTMHPTTCGNLLDRL